MASFKDLKTPYEIQQYLRDVLSQMKKRDESNLYHYSSISSITNIITSGYIWLGLSKNMNDHIEGEFIESFDGSNRICYSCFSQAEENLAMYKMYAPGPDGAMMVVPIRLAASIIDGISVEEKNENYKMVNIVRDNKLTNETVPAFLHWEAVAYKDLHSDTIRVRNAANTQIKTPLNIRELAGYVKLYGWEYEKEVRLVAVANNPLNDQEKIALKLPVDFAHNIEIVTAPGFDKKLHQKELSMLKRINVKIHESEYDSFVDIGTSIVDDTNKRIAELEMVNSELRNRLDQIEGHNEQKEANHLVEIKQEMQKLVDYSWVKTNADHIELFQSPWKKFQPNNLILRDIGVRNPSYNNGLIKVEPYDFYDDGILVSSSQGGGKINIKNNDQKTENVDVYIVEAIPFRKIYKVDMDGSENYPYPTLLCRFENNNPYEEEWYIDKNTHIRYTDDQIVSKDWEKDKDDKIQYAPTPIQSTDRSKISLYACIMSYKASIGDGRIMVLPTLANISYIAGGENMERNQTPRELARWDDAVSELYAQGYIKLIGKKDRIYALTYDGFNMAERFQKQCEVKPDQSVSEMLTQFGVPDDTEKIYKMRS